MEVDVQLQRRAKSGQADVHRRFVLSPAVHDVGNAMVQREGLHGRLPCQRGLQPNAPAALSVVTSLGPGGTQLAVGCRGAGCLNFRVSFFWGELLSPRIKPYSLA